MIDAKVRASGFVPTGSTDDKGNASASNQLESLKTERQLANAAMEGDKSLLSAITTDAASRLKTLRREVLATDVRYHDLLQAASMSEVQLASDRAVYTSHYPGLPALEKKVRFLDSSVDQEARRVLLSPDASSAALESLDVEQHKVEATLVADRAKIAAFDNLIASENARLDALPPIALLQLERSAAQAEYLSISGHRATALANRADALSLGSVSVVDRAIATEVQNGLSHKMLIALLILLSIIVACGSAFLAEALDPRLRRLSQIETLYGHEVIATLGTN